MGSAAALASLPLMRAGDAVFGSAMRATVVALVVLVAALATGWSRLVPAALVLLGSIYAAQLAVDDAPLDEASPVFAAGFLVTAELAFWSLEERERVQAEPGESLRHAAFVAALGVGALFAAFGLLVLVDAVRTGGLAVDVVGATAAAAALLAVVLVARKQA